MRMRLGLILFWSTSLLLLACAADKTVSSYKSNVNQPVSSSSENLSKEPNAMTNYNPNQSVSSPNNSSQEPIGRDTSEAISIEGKISQVMESFPLQLMVETKNGRYYVALAPETKITQQGKTVDTSKLNPGLTVKIQGLSSAPNQLAMTAQVIGIKP
ncbi:hypothetical protein [Scytonema sp. PCC 10023]|uniref:hypothetical protein n=1 Tax=Scytonema sp. PCC 10023 TaxID=1680591 RepID=UPI0039C5DEB8